MFLKNADGTDAVAEAPVPATQEEIEFPNGLPPVASQVDASEEQGNPPGVDKSSDTEKERYQYWQSKFTDAQKELDRFKLYAPIVQALEERKDVLEVVKKELTKPSVVAEKSELPEKPVAPSKPKNFDPVEAQTDPNSESFKYKVAYDEYVERLGTWIDAKEQFRQVQETQTRQAILEEQARRSRLQEMQRDLIGSYGFTPEQTVDFFRTMDDENAVTLEHVVQLYKIIKSKGAQTKQATPANRSPLKMPLPVGVGGGESPAPAMDDNDKFNASMAAHAPTSFSLSKFKTK